jgi:hypothetical protein
VYRAVFDTSIPKDMVGAANRQVADIYDSSKSILDGVAKVVPTMDLVIELASFEKERRVKDMRACWVNGENNHLVLVQVLTEMWKAITSLYCVQNRM